MERVKFGRIEFFEGDFFYAFGGIVGCGVSAVGCGVVDGRFC
jgi:hypothetical protein